MRKPLMILVLLLFFVLTTPVFSQPTVIQPLDTGAPPAQGSQITVKSAPSGPDITTTQSTWVNIPDMSAVITAPAASSLQITFSAEVNTTAGKRMFVRALVDGQPSCPGDVIFAYGSYTGTHAFVFTAKGLSAGGHHIVMQWLVDDGGTAYMGDRTLSLYASPEVTSIGGLVLKAAPSGPDVTTTQEAWADIPDMTISIAAAANSDLQITFSAEANTTSDKRMFVRALVDNQPAVPSDVIFAYGGFNGTHTFVFTAKALTAGVHYVTMQWSVDAGGTGYLGDRTLSVQASPTLSQHGGLSVHAAPSGPDVTTTQEAWLDIPDLSSGIAVGANSDLQIMFSAEANTSGDKRMFVRALVDNIPVSPSDVIFALGGYTGTHSYTFSAKGLSAGAHTVKMQWWIDAGGTGYLGDRTLNLNYWRAQVPDLSEDFYSLKPIFGVRKVVTIFWDPHRPTHPAPSRAQVEQLLYGSGASNMVDYYLENSNGRFTVENVQSLGWFDADYSWDFYWRNSEPSSPYYPDKWKGTSRYWVDTKGQYGAIGTAYYLDDEGFIGGHSHKWAEAVRKASEAGFNFADYDLNGDQIVSPDELGVLMIIPQNYPDGTNRPVEGKQVPNSEPLVVNGVQIQLISESYIGAPPSMGLVAHELAHLLLGADDMYFTWVAWFPYAAGAYSLMDDSPGNPPHLDPFHKLHLGWLTPRVITHNGYYTLKNVETSGEVLILYDPTHSEQEYFIIENRWRGTSYDQYLPDSGIAVWHIIEDQAVFSTLTAPNGFNLADWAIVRPHEWARRGIRMIRPVYGPPFNDNLALWDGSDPNTGYNLLSQDTNPNHVTLRWADGTSTGFSIRSFPAPGPEVELFVGVTPLPTLELLAPVSMVTDTIGNPIFQWPDAGLRSYQLFVGSETHGVYDGWTVFYNDNITTATCDTTVCSLRLTDLDPLAWMSNGTYQAYISLGGANNTAWAGPFHFRINSPAPAVPTVTGVGNTLTWTLEGDAQYAAWFNLYLAAQDNILVPVLPNADTWVSRLDACGSWDGTTCTLDVPGGLTSGTGYALYIRSWGAGGFSTGGNIPPAPGWVECMFVPENGVCSPHPTEPTNLKAQINGGIPTLTWASAQNATSYGVWLGVINLPDVQTVHYETHTAAQLGCESGGTCTLTLPDALSSDSYRWFVLAKGPGGVPVNQLLGWVEGTSFTVP